jgi:hypothetical protein
MQVSEFQHTWFTNPQLFEYSSFVLVVFAETRCTCTVLFGLPVNLCPIYLHCTVVCLFFVTFKVCERKQ